MAQLLAAAADAREAQLAVGAGTASGDDLHLASTRVREAIEAAVRAASSVLDRSDHALPEETARRIRTTLQAAATGGAAERLALWHGTLDRDLGPSGFGAPDGHDEDTPEVAKVIAPLRRSISQRHGRLAPVLPRAASGLVAQRAAARAAAERQKAAERARTIATTKRHNADRLAGEARAADDDACAAERAAEAAEKAAR
ncbi:MAG: hypothetical protein ABI352_12030 [Candidatus Dormibacter sp.]